MRIATFPIQSDDVFLFHKTTYRRIYEEARKGHADVDDVILWNEQQQITETTINNIIIKSGERLYTPPIECGVLGGTHRAWLLDRGEVQEKILTVDDLQQCDEILIVNSVQGIRKAVLVS